MCSRSWARCGPITGPQAYPSDSSLQAISATTTFVGTLADNSPVVSGIGSTTGLVAGQPVTGPGIPASATILTVDSPTAITLSEPATMSGPETLTAEGFLNSTATVPTFDGTFSIADITVNLNIAFTTDSDLSAVLIAPDGTQVPLFSGVGGTSGANFINTTFDDAAETSINAGTAPFTGLYRPAGMLSTLNGHLVDIKNAVGQWVPGVWKLQITNSATGTTGTLEDWSLNITPTITVKPVAPANGLATTFTVGFPQQQLSGTYTVEIGANVASTTPFPLDQAGDAIDSNFNAGLDVLRGGSVNSPVTTVGYVAADLPKPIPAPVAHGHDGPGDFDDHRARQLSGAG